MLKSIVVTYSCPTAYVIKHFNRALNFFKNGQTLIVYSSKTMHTIYLKFSVNVPAMVICSNISLYRHLKTNMKINING